jgi:hypothetical protein
VARPVRSRRGSAAKSKTYSSWPTLVRHSKRFLLPGKGGNTRKSTEHNRPFDLMTESLNVGRNGRADIPPLEILIQRLVGDPPRACDQRAAASYFMPQSAQTSNNILQKGLAFVRELSVMENRYPVRRCWLLRPRRERPRRRRGAKKPDDLPTPQVSPSERGPTLNIPSSNIPSSAQARSSECVLPGFKVQLGSLPAFTASQH